MLNGENYYPPKMRLVVAPLVGVVLIILAVFLVGLTRNAWKTYGYIGQSPEFKDRVTVDGMGKVTAVPDIAVINIGVTTEKATVVAAQKENTDKINAIVKSLRDEFKIDEKDMKTNQYNINPKYDWTGSSQRIIGYTINQSTQIKIRNFDKIGDILAKATTLGANNVYGPQFTIDDPEKFKEEARKKAIDQAKEKAKVLSQQVGIKLGKIVNFSEGGQGMPIMYDSYALGLGGSATMEKAAPAPDIQAGSQDIVVNVSISYEVK
ncbi:MAG: SIMPL domain-containing protein [Patescibacteria group bacterium]